MTIKSIIKLKEDVVFVDIIYKTSAVSTGGRDGKVVVENSPLEFEMALPTELGGTKIALNEIDLRCYVFYNRVFNIFALL